MRLLFRLTTLVFYFHIYSIIHLACPYVVFRERADLGFPLASYLEGNDELHPLGSCVV